MPATLPLLGPRPSASVRSARLGLVSLLVLWVILSSSTVLAETAVCVETRAAPKEAEAFHRLVLDELGHHPTHRVVTQGCASRLQVELQEIGGARFLTARVNEEIPVRYSVKPGDLGEKLSAALRQVLRHDPVYLAQDIREYNAVQRAAYSILRRGHTRFRLELYQSIINTDRAAAFAPGGAVALTRGADNWQIMARLYLAGDPSAVRSTDRALRLQTGADAGITYELNRRGSVSPYATLALGFQLLRFEGLSDPTDRQSLATAMKLGFTASGRAGVRFFRLSNFDGDLFVAGYLPFFRTQDPDTELIDRYTPSVQLGIGVGF